MLSWRAGEYVHSVLESRIIYTVHAVPESEITHICCPREQDNTYFSGYYRIQHMYMLSWREDVDPPRFTLQYMTNIMLNLSYG